MSRCRVSRLNDYALIKLKLGLYVRMNLRRFQAESYSMSKKDQKTGNVEGYKVRDKVYAGNIMVKPGPGVIEEASSRETVPPSRGSWEEGTRRNLQLTNGISRELCCFPTECLAVLILDMKARTGGTKEWNSFEYFQWEQRQIDHSLAAFRLWESVFWLKMLIVSFIGPSDSTHSHLRS